MICGGLLMYELMGGVVRVHREGRYRYRCSKCEDSGENDGAARTCSVDRPTKHWYAAQVCISRGGSTAIVTAILAFRSPEQAKAAVEAMHLVGAVGRDAYVWPPDETATLSRLPRSQAAYRAIEEEVRRRWGET